MGILAYLVKRLKETTDAAGTPLLRNTIVRAAGSKILAFGLDGRQTVATLGS
jgi:hypothetical protein